MHCVNEVGGGGNKRRIISNKLLLMAHFKTLMSCKGHNIPLNILFSSKFGSSC